MEKISIETIKTYLTVTKLLDIGVPEFIDDLIEAEKKYIAEKEDDERRRKEVYILTLPEGGNVNDLIKTEVSRGGYSDYFSDDEDLGDYGSSVTDYYGVDGKIYATLVKCDSEWQSEFSSRCNQPTNIRVESIIEVKEFETIKAESGYMIIKIK